MKNTLLSISLLTVILCLAQVTKAQPGPGGVSPIITEIMYNPPEANNDSLEFLEVYNPSSSAIIQMGGYYFTGVTYTFPAGFVLGPNQYVLISGDSVIFEDAYGMPAFEWTGATTQLSNSGEGLTLRAPGGNVVDTVFFGTTLAWPATANGLGASLVLCNTSADNNLPASWTASTNATGIIVNSIEIYADPGAGSTCTPTGVDDDNVITTLVYPNPSEGEFRVQFAPVSGNSSLRIHNGLGQLVHSESIATGTTTINVDADLNSGFYIVTFDNGTTEERFNHIVR